MSQIIFVLNEPALAENIGLSLRALKTMGFQEMRIIFKKPIDPSKLKKTAYGSHDLLEKIQSFQSLSEALSDIDLVIGTTSKSRTLRKDLIEVKELSKYIESKGDTIIKTAIVFGNEENGLSTEELTLCDIVTTVPIAAPHPSLNLGQAVLIYAYELSKLDYPTNKKQDTNIAEFKVMMNSINVLLNDLEISKNQVIHQRIKDRLAFASAVDVRMILSVLNKLKRNREHFK